MQKKKNRYINVDHLHNFHINIGSREVFIEPSEKNEMIDYYVGNNFLRNITLLNSISHNPIIVHLGTCGGDWDYGMIIYDAILNSKAPVCTISYGTADSMASIIPQAADWRIISPNCNFMIHYGSLSFSDTYLASMSFAKISQKCRDKMLHIYAQRCSNASFFSEYSIKEIKAFLKKQINENGDWYLSPQVSIKYGFMDAILSPNYFDEVHTKFGV